MTEREKLIRGLELCAYVEINAATGEARWGVRGYRDFMENPECHEVVGEIDLDGVILDAIKRAVKEKREKGWRKNELEGRDCV